MVEPLALLRRERIELPRRIEPRVAALRFSRAGFEQGELLIGDRQPIGAGRVRVVSLPEVRPERARDRHEFLVHDACCASSMGRR